MINEFILKKLRNRVAKKAKHNMLNLSFYKRKLRANNIPLNTVRNITSLEKLEKFLDKYKIEWVTEKELIEMSDTYSLPLSLVSQEERTWIQASSGYTFSAKLLLENEKNIPITRKRVAYTRKDLKSACKVYEGLEELLKGDLYRSVAIFGRLGDLCGSGTYPFLALSGNYIKLKVKTLYFGIPRSDSETLQWLKECRELNITGMIGIPSTLKKIVNVARSNDIFFDNLKLVGTGGDSLPRKLIEELYEIGAQLITIGWGAQEIAPLSTVAIGNVFSVNPSFPSTEGMGILGTLYFVRITDKNGESIDEEEEGYIRITSPFQGTTLIDYNTEDIGKFIADSYIVCHKNKNIKVPFPLLDYNISRSKEHSFRILEKNVYIKDLREICYSCVGYEYLLGIKDNFLHIYIGNNNLRHKEKIKEYLANLLPFDVLRNTYIKVIPRQILLRYLYPQKHYKPHNIVGNEIVLQLEKISVP